MSQTFASKTNRAFCQTVLTVVFALMAIVLASLKAYQISGLYLAVLIHKIKDACDCENMAQFFAMHPDIFRAAILFGVGIGIFIIYSLYKLVKLNSGTRKYIAHHLSFAVAGHSAKLKAAMKDLGIEKAGVVEINKADPVVFCFGYLKPKICVSRSLIDMLDKDELKAVLAHETQHMANYEPLKLFFVKYFRSIFFFLPGLKNSAKKYITLSELAADEHASNNAADKSSLAGAMLKISEQEEKLRLECGASLPYFNSGIEERVNRLNNAAYVPKFKFLDKSLIVGSLGLAVVSFAFIFIFSSGTKAFEMHNIASCVAPASSTVDFICANAVNHQNILSAGNSNFQNSVGVNFDQHFNCAAE